MSLITYDPFRYLTRLHDDLSRVLASPTDSLGDEESAIATSRWAPAVDIREDEHRFIIEADIPGVDPSKIEVSMENGVLSIKGERKTESETEDHNYKRVERTCGSFYRRFSLPDTADEKEISAIGKDGVLHVVIPKQLAPQPRKIKVHS